MSDVEPGRYQHWKGREYDVLGLGIHSETDEMFVVYVDPERSDPRVQFYLRPLTNFLEPARGADGSEVPRFVPLPRAG